MATPPQGLRAHEAGRRLGQRRLERRLPARGAHAGGIAAKGGDAKTPEAVLARLAGEPSTKLDRMPIGDPARFERRSDSVLVELRVVAGCRKAAHVDECADAGLA